jgi:hypothetical protein
MTSTALPPATASVPMVRAMFPVPMRVMLLMTCALFLFSRCRAVSFMPGQAQGVSRDVSGPTAAPFPASPARLSPVHWMRTAAIPEKGGQVKDMDQGFP